MGNCCICLRCERRGYRRAQKLPLVESVSNPAHQADTRVITEADGDHNSDKSLALYVHPVAESSSEVEMGRMVVPSVQAILPPSFLQSDKSNQLTDQQILENERFRATCLADMKRLAEDVKTTIFLFERQLDQCHTEIEYLKQVVEQLDEEKRLSLDVKDGRFEELEQRLADMKNLHRYTTNHLQLQLSSLKQSYARDTSQMDQERTEFHRIIQKKEANVQSLHQKLAKQLHVIDSVSSKVISKQQINQEWKHWKNTIHRHNEQYYMYLQRGSAPYDMDLIVDYQADESVMFAEESFNLPGVEVTGRTAFIITNKEDVFHWTEYGFKLTVPPDSLPAGVDHCVLDIIASTAGEYQFPDNHHLVSGVFWIRPSAPGQFKQRLIMEVQHCAKMTSSTKLSFVRAICSQRTLPYIFKPVRLQYCSFLGLESGIVCVNHFSGYNVTVETEEAENSSLIRRYVAILYYLSREVSLCTDIHIVVVWNDKTRLKNVERYYKKQRARKGSYIFVHFEEDSTYISLNIPESNGILVDNWVLKLSKSQPLMISDIDSFKPGQVIPALEIEATPQEKVNSLYYWLKLIGIKNPSENKLVISIQFPAFQENLMSSQNEEEAVFGIDDLQDIYASLIAAKNQWFDLGLALGIKYHDLIGINLKTENTESNQKLRDMLALRLQMSSPLTLEEIVGALKIDTVGRTDIAGNFTKKYKVASSKRLRSSSM